MSGIIERKFDQIDHQADLAFVIYGENEEDLLNSLIELMRDLLSVKRLGRFVKSVTLQNDEFEDLLFDVGNEIIFEFETNGLFPSNTTFQDLKVTLEFSTVEIFEEPVGIKALTYHGMKIERKDGMLKTIVVFDV